MKTIYKTLKFSITILILISSISVFGQKNLKKAEKLMDKYEYSKAAKLYEARATIGKASDTDIRNLTECYLQLNDTKNAEKQMSKLVEKASANQEDLKLYADLLKIEGKYDQAIEVYQKLEDTDYAFAQIKSLQKSQEWLADSTVYFEIENLSKLNSKNSDFSLIKFGEKYLFTSDRFNNLLSTNNKWTGTPFFKLYEVEIATDTEEIEVKNIKLLDGINDEYHNGPGVFDEKEQILYFTKTKTVKHKQRRTNVDPTSWLSDKSDEVFTDRLEIYSAKLVDGQWTEITAFEHNKAKEYSVGHPALSPDGNILYFVSDMPGGQGETDIYFCEKTANNTWGTPRNAGDVINTPSKEMFPVIEKNGTLYFSSDGHLGMGGLDMFKTTGARANWTKPENLKSPFNSSKDDFAILFSDLDGETGFFTSNRDGGQGADDIYTFKYIPPPPPPIPTELILAVSTWERMDDGKLEIAKDQINVMHCEATDPDDKMTVPNVGPGKYEIKVNCESKYNVNGFSPEFFAIPAQTIETHCESFKDTVFVQLIFERIVLDKEIVIENIYYDYDKANIRPDAAIELDKVVELLVENPGIIIELGSHTDSRGSDAYNLNLSQRRADSAVKYIIDNGIDKDRITAKGYGETRLLNRCSNGVRCSEEEHQLNRRTEFKVTGFIEGMGDVNLKSLEGDNIKVDKKPGEE
jgi:outer membrane protein OmpA-like peptidoglycan-associated protein/tetratricopeptide (TPR) repeat protein